VTFPSSNRKRRMPESGSLIVRFPGEKADSVGERQKSGAYRFELRSVGGSGPREVLIARSHLASLPRSNRAVILGQADQGLRPVTAERDEPEPLPDPSAPHSPMSPGVVSHGACGKTWRQVGDRTSHCAGCCQTFASLTLFEAHRSRNRCVDPAEITHRGQLLAQDVLGVWFSPGERDRARTRFGVGGTGIPAPDKVDPADHTLAA
jgi:hypothetical protein